MQKDKLNRFIQKYNLGGNVNSVKWESSGNKLVTKFVTPDKSLLGEVVVDKFGFEGAELGIYQTDQLQKLLNVLTDDINLSLKKVGDKAISLKVSDNATSVDYVLSDLTIIPQPPNLKHIPDFGTQIKLDSNFINTFIKGKSALSDVDFFTIVNKDDNLSIVIGYASTNTNRVNIPVNSISNDIKDSISFNANFFKEILVANKECTEAIFEISTEGLAKLEFKVDDYTSTYFLVASEDLD
tara:strand:+ start:702 stop:1421 length:720 start_codon:yes stop_codon:yes gene_type:complete